MEDEKKELKEALFMLEKIKNEITQKEKDDELYFLSTAYDFNKKGKDFWEKKVKKLEKIVDLRKSKR